MKAPLACARTGTVHARKGGCAHDLAPQPAFQLADPPDGRPAGNPDHQICRPTCRPRPDRNPWSAAKCTCGRGPGLMTVSSHSHTRGAGTGAGVVTRAARDEAAVLSVAGHLTDRPTPRRARRLGARRNRHRVPPRIRHRHRAPAPARRQAHRLRRAGRDQHRGHDAAPVLLPHRAPRAVRPQGTRRHRRVPRPPDRDRRPRPARHLPGLRPGVDALARRPRADAAHRPGRRTPRPLAHRTRTRRARPARARARPRRDLVG